MNQVFTGATALILALILWSFGKKPKEGIFSKISPKAIKELSEPQISLVAKKDISSVKRGSDQFFKKNHWQPPKSLKERKNLKDHLRKLMSSNPEDRLKAITIAQEWGTTNVLPILRRGLKDSDSRVVVAAASAIEKYRGTSHSTIN